MQIVVLISANIEWQAIRKIYGGQVHLQHSPYGEFFYSSCAVNGFDIPIIFFQGGWGKIAAASSTQFVIDHWGSVSLINLGTCGGFEGQIERGTIILVDRTIVYDIIEQMGNFDDHIAHYTTDIDLAWLQPPYPSPVKRVLLVSGDRDLLVEDLPLLSKHYGAVAGDWESGAIAWVANKNHTRLLILRGVSDLVGASGGEAYRNIEFFRRSTQTVMQNLVDALPAWLARMNQAS